MGQVTPGIYLEVKKGTIGTGVTAKSTEYRNFWITVSQDEQGVQAILLDTEFSPTGIREIFAVSDFESGRLNYIPEGEKKYQQLIARLTAGASNQPQSPPSPKPAQAGETNPKPAKWWESGQAKMEEPGDIFRRPGDGPVRKPGKKTTKTEVKTKKNWWETS